jgi:hypothetical protein
MNPAQKAAVAIFAVVIMSFYLANVEASPRIRSMRAQYQYMSKRNGNSIDTNDAHPSCHESLICGFAYYDTSRSRIRPIISYSEATCVVVTTDTDAYWQEICLIERPTYSIAENEKRVSICTNFHTTNTEEDRMTRFQENCNY